MIWRMLLLANVALLVVGGVVAWRYLIEVCRLRPWHVDLSRDPHSLTRQDDAR